jgi:N-acyl-phosphatidylethanolamine-hydrolysing phospholipase D
LRGAHPPGELVRGPGSLPDLLRWRLRRWRDGVTPNPPPERIPRQPPRIARPRAAPDALRVTWIGHSAFLVQIAGLNVLLDPVFSRRASPVAWAGPARLSPPGLRFDELPPIDAVILSHDHYDHLDERTVRRLHRRHGHAIQWLTPGGGYRQWLGRRGIERVAELEWWDEAHLAGSALRVRALPARHWSRRHALLATSRRWASFALRAAAGPRLFFAGDTGYFPGFLEIGARCGPFDAALLPIGAYEPAWFMRPAHMNPEEAVRAFRELGGAGAFIPCHRGTFRLTDEDPLEPPARLRAAWTAAALPPDRLHLLGVGGTWAGAAAPR